MLINLIAIGKNMPHWVSEGFTEYTKRLPSNLKVTLTEISMVKRSSQNVARAIRQEEEQMLAAIPKKSYPVALDVAGQQWSTEELATHLARWQSQGQDLSLLVGGPEGLSEQCLHIAKERWSLSALTFPHPLVRIIIAEQLYRAWSILSHHPYHRN